MRILFFSLLLTVCLLMSAFAVPPSPAGGGALRIYERGDHVSVPDHPDFDVNLQANGFTLEMWIYLERPLQERVDMMAQPLEFWSLLHKDGSYKWEMYPSGSHGFTFFTNRVRQPIGFGPHDGFEPQQWYYIALTLTKTYRQAIINNQLRGIRTNLLHFDDTDAPLRIGGGRAPLLGATPGPFFEKPIHTNFTAGRIDAVRISNIVRYPQVGIAAKKVNETWQDTIEMPTGRFEPDAHTVALWHFDFHAGTWKWRDASGNGHHLTYNGNYLTVRPRRKLATTWAALKGRNP